MSLKDFFESDNQKSFFNDFGDIHEINGQKIKVVIDNDQLIRKSKGKSIGEIFYFVSKSEFGERPEEGTSQIFDGKLMYVSDCSEDNVMYEITLRQNRGV